MVNKFKIIYVDNPLQFQNWTKKKNGAAISHYNTLSTNDLCALPVNKIADNNSVIFSWTSLAKLKESIEIIEAWGFEFISTAFVWNKTYKNNKPYCGLGFYTRSGAEICLLGKKGKAPKRLSASVRQVITYPVKQPHSSKPPETRDRILQLFGDLPRIELFSREPSRIKDGWVHVGWEVDNQDIRDSLKQVIDGTYV